MRLINLFALLFLFLLVACDNGKKDFMTLKKGEILLDVDAEMYSLNGKVLGKTADDFLASDDILIAPLDRELKRIRQTEQEELVAKLLIDENHSYDVFLKSIATMTFNGYDEIKFVIGSSYKDIFHYYHIHYDAWHFNSCELFLWRMKWSRLNYERNRQTLSVDDFIEILEKQGAGIRINKKECVENYNALDLQLNLYRKDDGNAYVISLNESYFNKSRLFDGYSFYTFNNEDDLWKFVEDVRSRVKSQTEQKPDKKENGVLRLLTDVLNGPNKIVLAFENDALMKDLAPLFKKLNTYGYRFTFSRAR